MLERIIKRFLIPTGALLALSCGEEPLTGSFKHEDVFEETYLAQDSSNNCKEKRFYADKDNDGYGSLLDYLDSCEHPAGYVKNSDDCDDSNPSINPEAPEICNEIDDNCNKLTDEGVTLPDWYKDVDGDGYGDSNYTLKKCNLLPGYASISGDCKDNHPTINPNMIEECDNIDNNCDGNVDEGITPKDCSTDCGQGTEKCFNGKWQECTAPQPTLEICDFHDNDCDGETDEDSPVQDWFIDGDSDGYGSPNTIMPDTCAPPPGYIENDLDCDDSDSDLGSLLQLSDSAEWKCSATTYPFLALDGNERVYINDDKGYLHVIGIGEDEWVSSEKMIDPVIGKDGTIYVKNNILTPAGFTAKITALDQTFEEKWTYLSNYCTGPGWLSGSWDTVLSHQMSLSSEGNLYVGVSVADYDAFDEYCGYIEAINPEGKQKWIYPNIGYFETGTSVGQGEVIYGGVDYTLYTVYPNGTLKEQKDLSSLLSSPISQSPVFGPDGELYLTTNGGELASLKLNGELLVLKEEGMKGQPIIDSEGRIYTTFAVLDPKDNMLLYFNPGDFSGVALATNNLFYYFGKDGLLAVNRDKWEDTEGNEVWDEEWWMKENPETMVGIAPVNLAIGKEGTLYFCNAADNTVYAVCGTHSLDKDAPWPILDHDNQRTKNFNNK